MKNEKRGLKFTGSDFESMFSKTAYNKSGKKKKISRSKLNNILYIKKLSSK
jgi:hypothetical protein